MRFSILILAILSFISCDKKEKKSFYESRDGSETATIEISAQEAKKLMENKCYICHNPSSSEKNRIGPPMAAIKAHYMKDSENREEFISEFWHFVERPTKEKAKLKGAVKRFGVMPYQKYKEEEIRAIAAYMYDYQIEEPDWFKSHWEEKQGEKFEQAGESLSAENESQSIEDVGLSYALSTKKELGKNLMGAIQKEGVIYALEFCNVEAMPITEKMAEKHNATIMRVSDKNRNPANEATSEEVEYINLFQKQINNGEEPEAVVISENGNNRFYYPIVTNDMCLKCHGNVGEQTEQATYDKILELYPNDKAIGYDVNEVRGIWRIEFE